MFMTLMLPIHNLVPRREEKENILKPESLALMENRLKLSILLIMGNLVFIQILMSIVANLTQQEELLREEIRKNYNIGSINV